MNAETVQGPQLASKAGTDCDIRPVRLPTAQQGIPQPAGGDGQS